MEALGEVGVDQDLRAELGPVLAGGLALKPGDGFSLMRSGGARGDQRQQALGVAEPPA